MATKYNALKHLKKHPILWAGSIIIFVLWLFCLPSPLFSDSTSTVVMSNDGHLLGARISDDGQWRFPAADSIPNRFKQSIIYFEDEHFYSHIGINPVSTLKAFWNNLTTHKRRGGSTLTQQVIRLAHKNPKRTYWEKLIESFQATRLEVKYSKENILKYYAAHAPFGSNVVGLSAASWRYFGIPEEKLSWGQAATLAVLPNAPGLIYPGKNEQVLKDKRDALLQKLYQKKVIDQTTFELAVLEPLPSKPLQLPDIAPHFVEKTRKEHRGERIKSTIDYPLQQKINTITTQHYLQLKQNQIHNLAVIVLDVDTRKVLAYVGNSPTDDAHQKSVDIITRPRSTGSILKPFLYAAMMDSGELLPDMLVADIPTNIDGYTPKNYDKAYRGAAPASVALAQSLNVPAVRLLQDYGLERFTKKLHQLHQSYINKPAGYYGLSLILGGAESSLWDITNAYAGMAHIVKYYNHHSSTYLPAEFNSPILQKDEVYKYGKEQFESKVFGAGAAFATLDALKEVNRPMEQSNWEMFESAQPIAWKTGTSYGFKDAWAVGTTAQYAIGVWVGNANGEGRPGLVGIEAAAPILFDVLDQLPQSDWFQEPYDDMTAVEICKKSGHLAGVYCDDIEERWIPKNGLKTKSCPYHQRIQLNETAQYQVNSSCYPLDKMLSVNWFSLPTVEEYYYQTAHPNYKTLPPFKEGCLKDGEKLMAFIYPKANQHIILPKNFKEETNPVIFKLAHSGKSTKVYWYLNNQFLGRTEDFHEISVIPEPGDYILKAIDQEGNEIAQSIHISLP